MRKFFAALLSATMLSGAAYAASATFTVTVGAQSQTTDAGNTMTVTDASGLGETNYPLQFGRPFIQGHIPSGTLPQVLINGTPVPTQADVKNRYPDGSVEFAVMSVVVPSIPANGSVTLGFQSSTADSNTPLTAAQMLDASYNFDASTTVQGTGGQTPTVTASGPSGSLTFNGQTITFGAAETGGYDVLFNGTANGVATKVDVMPDGNLYADNTAAGWYVLNGSTWTHLSYDPEAGQAGTSTSVSARTMLQNGDYTLWTSGPVAQTIVLADDTAARKYDIGTGDGYHPLRPRFEATFWPTTHQVFVRALGENGLSSEIEDLTYGLTVTLGQASPATIESTASLYQPALTTWSRTGWIDGAPQAKVNIDNNLAYLESTRFVPNFDPSISLPETTIANDYATWWTSNSHDAIGSAGAWTPGMETTGEHLDIGLYPAWDVAWLYSGDWRIRQLALGNTDLAGWWSVNARSTDPTTRLNRGDVAGTEYGHPLSITDRVCLGPSAQGLGAFLNQYSGCSAPAHKLTQVGPVTVDSNGGNGDHWWFEQAHLYNPWFVAYALTGDPWYSTEEDMWAAYSATTNNGGPMTAAPGIPTSYRGATGAEGFFEYELRGAGWLLRSIAEASFIAPDSDPDKNYFRVLTQEDIARWEGALGVANPELSADAQYTFGENSGDPLSATNFGPDPAPALGNWEAATDNIGNESYWTDSCPGTTNPWMQNFANYGVDRARELGFAATSLAQHSDAYNVGVVNSTGAPELVGLYGQCSWLSTGQIANWPQFVSVMEPAFLTGSGYTGTGQSVPTQFQAGLSAAGYDMQADMPLAMAVDNGTPGASQAWSWYKANVLNPLAADGQLSTNPMFDLVPRTDSNVLPAQSTADPAP